MSDIRFIIGGIGSGKSWLAADFICNELLNGERMVVSTLEVFTAHAPNGYLTVGEWCAKNGRSIEWRKRIRILTEVNERLEFYMHYPGFDLMWKTREVEVVGLDAEKYKGGVKLSKETVPDLATRQQLAQDEVIPHGCLFVLDEAHIDFSARAWQRIGPHVESYMSQCRKFNDDVIIVSQHPEKVDANFRRNATKWRYVKNLNKMRFVGGVSFKDRFRWREYGFELPKIGTHKEVADDQGFFQLRDRDIHLVYDTTGGSGLKGTRKPKAEKPIGGHPIRWAGYFALIVLGVWLFTTYGMKGIGGLMGGAMRHLSGGLMGNGGFLGGQKVVSSMPAEQTQSTPITDKKPTMKQAQDVTEMFHGKQVGKVEDETNVFVCGSQRSPQGTNFYFTDGDVCSLLDVSDIKAHHWLVRDGKRYYWLKRKDKGEGNSWSGSGHTGPVVLPLRQGVEIEIP